MALRKALLLIALGVSASLLMGCAARLSLSQRAGIELLYQSRAALSQLKARNAEG